MAALLRGVDRSRWAIFGLVALLYAAGFNGTWRMSADGALYMALGLNLAEGRGYTYLGEHHAWVEPGLPWVVAAAYTLGGRAYGPALVDAALLAAAAAALFFVYQLIQRVFDRPTAVVVTAMTGLSHVFYRVTLEVMTDVPFVAALFATLLAYEWVRGDPRRPRGWVLAAAGILAMVAVRPVSMTVIAAIAATAGWHAVVARRQWKRHALLAGLAVAIFFAFRFVDPRRDEGAGETVYMEKQTANVLTTHLPFYLKRAFGDLGQRVAFDVWPNAVVPIRADGLDQVIGLALLAAAVALLRVRTLWAAVAVLVLLQAAMWSDIDRYVLPPLPLILAVFATAAVWVARRLPPAAAGALVAVLLALYFGPNAAEVGKLVREQRATPASYSVGGEWSRDLASLATAIRDHVGEGDTVLAANNRVLAFLAERNVPLIPKLPAGLPRPELIERTERALGRSGGRLWVVLPLHPKTRFYVERMRIAWDGPVARAGDLSLHPARFLANTEATTQAVDGRSLDPDMPKPQ